MDTNEPIFPEVKNLDDYDQHDLELFNNYKSQLEELKFSAIKTAIKDKYTQYYKKLIDEEQYQHFPGYAGEELKKVHKLKQKADNITDIKQGNNSHCFFTINFKPEYSTEEGATEVHNELKKFTKESKFVSDKFAYAIEQRSDNEENINGLHAHIIFEKGNNAPSKIQRAFKGKFFDKYVGSPACLDYRYITSDKVTQKLDYILGVKSKEKMGKVLIDRVIRPRWNLPQIYHNNMKDEIEERIKVNNLPNTFI